MTAKNVFITFDDGPTTLSHEILDVLDMYNAKATFFTLEPYMKKHKDVIRRIVKENHGIGLHGVTHQKDKFYKSSVSVVSEMDKANKTLNEISGINSKLIRTPYGSIPYMTKEYREATERVDYKMWDWNVDSRDWEHKSKFYVENTINQIEKLKNSKRKLVVLLHELPTTLEYLHLLLNYLKENNYEYKILTKEMEPEHFNSR